MLNGSRSSRMRLASSLAPALTSTRLRAAAACGRCSKAIVTAFSAGADGVARCGTPSPHRGRFGPSATWGDPASFPGGCRPDVVGALIAQPRADLRLRITREAERLRQAAAWHDRRLAAELPALHTFERQGEAHIDLSGHEQLIAFGRLPV